MAKGSHGDGGRRAKGGRKATHRAIGRHIVIYVEGDVTEPEYLAWVLWRLRLSHDLCEVHTGGNIKHCLDEVLVDQSHRSKRKGLPKVDEWWIVADSEGELSGLRDLFAKAARRGIRIALNDTCVELWLLLHFERANAGMDGLCAQLIAKLRKYLPAYSERDKHPNMEVLGPRLGAAMEHARDLRADPVLGVDAAPRTDMDLLVRSIYAAIEDDAHRAMAGNDGVPWGRALARDFALCTSSVKTSAFD